MSNKIIDTNKDYKYGFTTDIETFKAPKGLSEETIKFISKEKKEPKWLLDWRLKAYKRLKSLKEPNWQKPKYPKIDYQDLYYYSAPKSLKDKPKSEDNKSILPLEKFEAQCMSMGFLIDEQTPMMWRGPMVISAIKTMTQKVLWKDRDIIIIDMPPGTGDTQLTFVQEVKIDGAIIVSTPQDLALLDVKRGIQMYEKTGVKILGLIENMSFFKGDDGKEYKIFGEGGVEKTAKEFKKQFLGKLPLNEDLRSSADNGEPLTYAQPDHEISTLLKAIAEKIKQSFQ